MKSHRPRSRSWKGTLTTLLIVLGGTIFMPSAHATVWSVDGSAPGCSNGGPGTDVLPLCTIGAGVSRARAGDTVRVNPAIYREQVNLAFSGTSSSPIVVEATGSGAIVLGSIDVSDPAGWSSTATNAWSRSFTATPRQVLVDGVRLTTASGAGTTTNGSFYYDALAGLLYVDIGGANPGVGHSVEAGTRTYGFNVPAGLSNLVIQGFATRYQNSAGVRVINASAIVARNIEVTSSATYGVRVETVTGPVTIDGCTVTGSASVGISLSGAGGVSLLNNTSHHNDNSGIALQTSNGNLIEGNVCYSNFRPNVRAAVGIDVNNNSSNNIVRRNTLYSNQDSGMNVYNGANNTLVARNVSYDNGDHGFDTNGAVGTRYISNTSFHNFNDGFSIEGSSTSTSVYDNIASDNGLTTGRYDLYVDTTSPAGIASDWNLFWNSTPGAPIKFNGITYSSTASFSSATTLDPHGRGSDPRFRNPAIRDLHLDAASPAIDSADSSVSNFILMDHDGITPVDDPGIGDTGAGSPAYADRGAFERPPIAGDDHPPIASLFVSPSSGDFPILVTADASASTDADSTPIASYTFDYGDGTSVVGPQVDPVSTHTYQAGGTFTVTLTVTDTVGLSDQDTAQVSVFTPEAPPVARLTVTPSSGVLNLNVTADASASTDTDATPIATYTFDFGDGSPAVGPQAGATATHTFTASGAFTVTVTVADTNATSSTATRTVIVRDDPPVARLSVSPNTGLINLNVTANASASTDSDATPIASYTFDFGDGSAVVGPQAGPTAPHTYITPGTYTVRVTVRDTAGGSGTATATVTAKDNPPTVVAVATPTSGGIPFTTTINASGSTDNDGSPIASYTFDFKDGTIVGPQTSPTATHTYTVRGNYKINVTVKDTNGLSTSKTIMVQAKTR